MSNTLTLDSLFSGENLEMTFNPNTALGTGGVVEIYGNKIAGRIVVTTGVGSDGYTLGKVLFPIDNQIQTDNYFVFVESFDGRFFQVCAQAVEGTGFEIYSKELWEDSATYEFKYFIISHIQ